MQMAPTNPPFADGRVTRAVPRVGVALVLLVLSLATAAAAPPARVVMLPHQSGLPTGAKEVHQAVRVHLAELPGVAVLPAVGGPEPAKATAVSEILAMAREVATQRQANAVVWLGYEDSALYLFVWDAEAQQALRRRLAPLTGTASAQEVEQAAAIVRWAIQALIDRQTLVLEPIAIEEPPQEAPAVEPSELSEGGEVIARQADLRATLPVTQAQSSRAQVLLWLGYTGAHFAPKVAWHDGVLLGVGLRFDRVVLSVAYSVMPTIDVTGANTQAEIQRRPVEVRLLRQQDWGRWGLLWGGALMVDASTRNTMMGASDSALVPADQSTSLSVGAGPQVALSFRLQKHLNLYLGVGADFMLRSVRYHEEVQDDKAVLAPHRLRARADMGVMVPL